MSAFQHTANATIHGWSGTVVTDDLIDLTGDGLVDYVVSGSAGAWLVYPNTGVGFGPPQHFPGAFKYLSFSTTDNGLVYGTFDINGDALADAVWSGQNATDAYKGSWTVCLNSGHGMAQPSTTGACQDWALPEQGEWRFVRKGSGTEPLDTVRDFFDINGDGLPDVVDRNGWGGDGNWRVYLNRGSGFESSVLLWPSPTQFIRNGSPGGGGTLADTFDVNGDGLVDNVVFNESLSGGTYKIYHPLAGAWRTKTANNSVMAEENPAGLRPDLLVRSESGSGGETVLHYRPSTQWDNRGGDTVVDLPFVSWTVSDIRHRDGLCPAAQTAPDGSCADLTHQVGTTIDYEGGRFDPVAREFRGFNRVYVKPIADASTPRAATLTVFHQTALFAGKIEQSVSYNTTGSATTTPISATLNTWECADRSSGAVMTCPSVPDNTTSVRLKTTTARAYSTPASNGYRESVTENVSWSQCGSKYYGNVADARRGDPSGNPRLNTFTEYACRDDSSDYIVDRPTHVVVRDSDGVKVLEEKWFWYDQQSFNTLLRGNATRIDSLLEVNDVGPAATCTRTPSAPGGCVSTSMVVDTTGNITSVTDALGRTTTTSYDSLGLYPARVTQPEPAAGQTAHKTWSTYDPACGVLLATSIPYLSTLPGTMESTRHTYDAFCRRTKTFLPGDADNGTAYREYTYRIGAPGYPTVTTTTQREPHHSYGKFVSSVLADGLGRAIQTKTESVINGSWAVVATATTYDAVGRAVRQYLPFVFDVSDGFEAVSLPPASGFRTLQYDAAGRVIRTTNPDDTYRTADYAVAGETTTRDECMASSACTGSRTVEKRDALGRVVERWVYDEANAIKGRTRYEYDAMDRLVLTEQGDGDGGEDWNAASAIGITYDTLGRKVGMDDPDSGTWLYRYDLVGNLVLQDDPKPDAHVELCYDAMDRVTKKFYVPLAANVLNCGLAADITYTYSTDIYGLGQLAKVVDTSGESEFANYTVRGEARTVRRKMNSVTAETKFVFDDVGHMLAMIYPDGEVVLYDYDAVGRVKRMFNDSGAPVYLDSLKYDIFGRPLTIAHGNGAVDARTYATTAAERYRLTRIRADVGGTPLFNYGYGSYTATGLLGSRTDDGWVSGQPPMMKGHGSYTYDGVGRLTQVTDTVGTRGYSHDEWGNLASKEGVTFSYGEAAHPHRVTGFTGSGSGAVEHDENGNRLGRDGGGAWTEQAYRYDPEDRLARVTVGPDMAGSPAVEFGYDYGGRRTQERRGTVQSNGTVAVQESTNYYSDVFEVRGNRARKYYIAGGLLVASRDVPAPATLQVASAGGGAVQVATVWQAGSPTVAFTLSGSALSAATAVLATGGIVWLLLPGRRRRVGLGLRLRTADVVLIAVVSLSSAAPWPFLVQPAYAQKTGPTPTPTAVPPAEVHHYHLDHLGSPQTVTDGYGSIVEQVRYDPYGAVRGRWKPVGGFYNTTGLTEQDRREFTGYQTEPLSELNYANARFYDPDFATFLTHDPAREFASPYTYTGWDPINVTDPSGACVWDLCLGEILTAVAIGAAAGFAANAIQAAVNGASIGDIFKAGAIGGAIGGAGAGLGFVAGVKLGIALTNAIGAAGAETAMRAVSIATYIGGAGQAAYGLSQGDYTGLISLGIGIGLGFALRPNPQEEWRNQSPGPGPKIRTGTDNGALVIQADGKDMFRVTGGLDQHRIDVAGRLRHMLDSRMGREAIDIISAEGQPRDILVNYHPRGNATHGVTGKILINPIDRGVYQSGPNTYQFSIERTLAHEIGHSVFRATDSGVGSLNNVLMNENRWMRQLGDFNDRTVY